MHYDNIQKRINSLNKYKIHTWGESVVTGQIDPVGQAVQVVDPASEYSLAPHAVFEDVLLQL